MKLPEVVELVKNHSDLHLYLEKILKKNKKYTKVSLSDIDLLGGSFFSITPFFRTINQTFNYKFGNEIAGQEGLYRVFFNGNQG